jgi:homoserine dehydrogenase
VVGIANARDGFVYDERGLDLGSVLAAAGSGRPVTQQRGARCWPGAIEGLRATEADLLVEVTASPPGDGEPGLAHMREALQRRIPVVTSNKWPVALHGAELAALARRHGVAFRAESTVMSGTPVLGALAEGMAGAVPAGLRGVLNATANAILSRMAGGIGYADALAEAQRAGLAEPDPAADVQGHDTVAKVMVLSALVFGRQLSREQVSCQGITGVTVEEARQAASAGGRLRHVATLAFAGPDGTGTVTARAPRPFPPRTRWPASTAPAAPWSSRRARSGRSPSPDPAPGRTWPARGRSPTSSPSHEGGHPTRDVRRPQPDPAPAGPRAQETHPQPGIISRTPPTADATLLRAVTANRPAG